jgi:hypothetical protein
MTALSDKRCRRRRAAAAASLAALLGLAGCGSPSSANVELRRQNLQLQQTIDQLKRQDQADQASIRALQQGATTIPSLPQNQLNPLFTVAGLKFGRLTGGYRPDPNKPGDTMLKVYVVPVDEDNDVIKAAGSFHVELFDLALAPANTRIGLWDFPLDAARSHWFSGAFMYTYVLDCPWQTVPIHSNLLARITYTDALTHRVFTVDREVKVQPPQ